MERITESTFATNFLADRTPNFASINLQLNQKLFRHFQTKQFS